MSNTVTKESQKQELNILPLLTVVMPVCTILVVGGPSLVNWLNQMLA